MSQISALKTFPHFSIENASLIKKDVVNVLTMMISIMYVCFFSFIHKMHPKNQMNFLCAIPGSTKKKVNEKMS